VGSNSAAIQLWDVEKEKRVRTMGGHTDRVGILTWSKHTLTR
jgi:cell division cycle 20-like protein 1 (cofactor of APC complex)